MAVTDTTYPGALGEMPARIYRPKGVDGLLPVIVFFHGGGFIGGSIDAYDKPCRGLAEDLGAVVISPSYRLAPEHPFPAAPDDAFAALQWAARVAPEHGGDPDRLVVAGESAGGNLAAVTALRARDEGGPALAGQVLINPITELDAQTPSRVEFANAPVLTAAAVDMIVEVYVAGDRAQTQSPLASPALASSHADLPPTLIVTMECDPLRSEGEDYGRLLEQAGVPVRTTRLDGMVHGTFELAGVLPRSQEITTAIASYLTTIMTAVEQPVG